MAVRKLVALAAELVPPVGVDAGSEGSLSPTVGGCGVGLVPPRRVPPCGRSLGCMRCRMVAPACIPANKVTDVITEASLAQAGGCVVRVDGDVDEPRGQDVGACARAAAQRGRVVSGACAALGRWTDLADRRHAEPTLPCPHGAVVRMTRKRSTGWWTSCAAGAPSVSWRRKVSSHAASSPTYLASATEVETSKCCSQRRRAQGLYVVVFVGAPIRCSMPVASDVRWRH